MDASQEHSPRIGEKEKEDVSIEDRPLSQTSLLALPEPGTPERLLAERKLVRKLDSRVLPTIFVIYIMNYIDVWVLICRWLPTDKNTTAQWRHNCTFEGTGTGSAPHKLASPHPTSI